MATEHVQWAKELEDLVATAKSPGELEALKAFQAALGPYLQRPELLRTLLGKIKQGQDEALGVLVGKGEFNSLDDVEKILPKGQKLIRL
jgi:hypothetical protein